MVNLRDLTIEQLRKAAAIKEQIETLQQQLETITGNGISARAVAVKASRNGKRSTSAAGKGKTTEVAKEKKARLLEEKALVADEAKPAKKRKMSAEGKAKMAAAAKARWAKVKAEGKTKL